jgi:hypothetical protein
MKPRICIHSNMIGVDVGFLWYISSESSLQSARDETYGWNAGGTMGVAMDLLKCSGCS